MKMLEKYKSNDMFDVEIYDSIPSTNSFLKEELGKEGRVIVALSQEKGRGRFNRKFYSNYGGLYFSILLKPTKEIVPYLTALAGVAVAKTIDMLSNDESKIKWVNDVYAKGKKCCGILAESKMNNDGSVEYVILGIGINTKKPENGFDKDIENVAGYVLDDIDNKVILDGVLFEFKKMYKSFDKEILVREYKDKCFVIDKKVVIDGIEYLVKDIDSSLRLVCENKDKSIQYFNSGEISVILQ